MATGLSQKEFASVGGERNRERCQFIDEPVVCVHYDSLVVVSEGSAHIGVRPA